MTETITRRQVRHPKDFGDRELFKRAFTHWIPSEKVDALYSELQGDFKKVCELSIEELKHYGLTQRDAIACLPLRRRRLFWRRRTAGSASPAHLPPRCPRVFPVPRR